MEMIAGVQFKELTTHCDDRGFFREVVRATDDFFAEGFGQWSHSMMFDNVTKAWHWHSLQTDWWYICTGVIRVGLHDLRDDSPTQGRTMDFYMGDFQPVRVVKIPPGVVHGCKTVQGPVHLLYITSHTYNPEDEHRIQYNDPGIGFDWLKGPEIK